MPAGGKGKLDKKTEVSICLGYKGGVITVTDKKSKRSWGSNYYEPTDSCRQMKELLLSFSKTQIVNMLLDVIDSADE